MRLSALLAVALAVLAVVHALPAPELSKQIQATTLVGHGSMRWTQDVRIDDINKLYYMLSDMPDSLDFGRWNLNAMECSGGHGSKSGHWGKCVATDCSMVPDLILPPDVEFTGTVVCPDPSGASLPQHDKQMCDGFHSDIIPATYYFHHATNRLAAQIYDDGKDWYLFDTFENVQPEFPDHDPDWCDSMSN